MRHFQFCAGSEIVRFARNTIRQKAIFPRKSVRDDQVSAYREAWLWYVVIRTFREKHNFYLVQGTLENKFFIKNFFVRVICVYSRGILLLNHTMKCEVLSVQEIREIFTFRGNKLSRMTSYEKFRGNKLSRWPTFKRFHGNKKRRKSKFVRRNICFYCTVLRWDTWPVLKLLKNRF